MKFTVEYLNELPFMIEMPDGEYTVKTKDGSLNLNIYSNFYKLHVAPFPENANKWVYYDNEENLKDVIFNERIPNYAFSKSKTFVKCIVEKDIEIEDSFYDKITQEKCITEIESLLIKKRIEYTDPDDLKLKAHDYYSKVGDEELKRIKFRIIANGLLYSITNIYEYYDALNSFMEQYGYLRNIFWVYKLDENTLQGTHIRNYINGSFYDEYTFGGLAPSILPYRRLFPDLNEPELQLFKDRLKNSYEILLEKQLIIVARSLWYRCEYRSAIMESSAALEIAVEKKIVDKMKLNGLNHKKRKRELNKTLTNFKERCDKVLKKYTGTSFVVDNAKLWGSIEENRKKYRHKIVHSSTLPDGKTCEIVIDKFEEAIDYINSL